MIYYYSPESALDFGLVHETCSDSSNIESVIKVRSEYRITILFFVLRDSAGTETILDRPLSLRKN